MGGHIIAAFTSANVGFDTYFGFYSRFLQLQEVPENNTKELKNNKKGTPHKSGVLLSNIWLLPPRRLCFRAVKKAKD